MCALIAQNTLPSYNGGVRNLQGSDENIIEVLFQFLAALRTNIIKILVM